MFTFEGVAVYIDPTTHDVTAIPGAIVEFLDPATNAVLTVLDASDNPVTSVTADSTGAFYAAHATVYRVRPRYGGVPSQTLLTAPSALDAAQDALTAASAAQTAASAAGATATAAAATANSALAIAQASAGSDSGVAGFIDNDASLTVAALGRRGLVSATAYGATGDGVTDDTAAINAAIAANPGRTIYIPAGTYMIDPDSGSTGSGLFGVCGILLDQPGVRLLLDPGATLEAVAGTASGYAVIAVTAADCAIIGGHILGERDGHIGSTGEHGMGIIVLKGADRLLVDGVRVSRCWGDGIYVNGSTSAATITTVSDVTLRSLRVHGNRRNNLSIVAANRCTVIGGTYTDASGTAPQAGIDVEPNPSAGTDVKALTIIGAVATGNAGSGIQAVFAAESTITGSIAGCVMNDNGAYGFQGVTGTGGGSVSTQGNTMVGNATAAVFNNSPLVKGQITMAQNLTLPGGWTANVREVRDCDSYVMVSYNNSSPTTAITNTSTTIGTLPSWVGQAAACYGVVRNRTAGTIFDLQIIGGVMTALNLTTTGVNTIICQVAIPK